MSESKYPTPKQLEDELSNKKLHGIYLFIGEEEAEKEKLIDKIAGLIFISADDRTYSFGRFNAGNDEFPAAADFVLSQSMFSGRKLCLIKDIDRIRSSGADAALFNELLQDIPESNILIMTSGENRPPSCIPKTQINKIRIVQFWRLFERDLQNYIIKTIKKHGLTINGDAVNMLLGLLGRDIGKIDGAIEKMINSGVRSVITPEIVADLIQDEKDVSVFDFINALFKKNAGAYNMLFRLLESGIHELQILSMVVSQAEKIERFHFLVQKGMSADDAMREIKIYSAWKKDFIEQLNKNSHQTIKEVFPLIYKADYRIKSAGNLSLISNPITELVTEMLLAVRA